MNDPWDREAAYRVERDPLRCKLVAHRLLDSRHVREGCGERGGLLVDVSKLLETSDEGRNHSRGGIPLARQLIQLADLRWGRLGNVIEVMGSVSYLQYGNSD